MKAQNFWMLFFLAITLAFLIYFYWWPEWSCKYKLWVAERLLKKLAKMKDKYTPEQQAEHLRVARAIKRIRKNIEEHESDEVDAKLK